VSILLVGFGKAYTTIAEAMLAAVSGDTISLAADYGSEDVTVTVENLTIVGGAGSLSIKLKLASGTAHVHLGGEVPIVVDDGAKTSPAIDGTDGANVISVRGGGDVVSGGGGNDQLMVVYSGGTGTTAGNCGAGFASEGIGTIGDGVGFDRFAILAGAGVDTIATGAGDDTITADKGLGANTNVAGAGNNDIATGGGIDATNTLSGTDTIVSGDAVDTITTGAGDDLILIWGGSGAYRCDG
jgi:hypothetical protein